MYLIVGLGNPGAKYSKNRHNIGFVAIDEIATRYSSSDFTSKFLGLFATCEINSQKIFLLKPQTYMNLSGKSVAACANFYKIPLENIVVLHDELDLECGRLKCKIGGGSAGHNGLKSIDAAIGPNYTRVRIGVSRPEYEGEVSNYVLGDFNHEQGVEMIKVINAIACNMDTLVAGNLQNFMNNCALDIAK